MALRIEKKKKKKRRVDALEERPHEFGVGVAALEPHPRFLDSQQLCFFFFFFLKVQIQREAGNHEKRSDHGSQNREVRPRFAQVLTFSHRAVFEAKRTTKMSGSRFSQSNRMVRSGFQNLGYRWEQLYLERMDTSFRVSYPYRIRVIPVSLQCRFGCFML